MKKTHNLINWWLPFIVLCIVAYWIQIHLYLHKDVAILSHTAAQILQGQTYAHDIFEPNPPLIFYLHALPILLAQLTGIKIIYVLRLVLLAFIILSVVSSRLLLRKIIVMKEERYCTDFQLLNIISYGIALALLYLPAEEFGQREHFFIILTLPYIILAVYRLQHHALKIEFALGIGFMAGLGFAIKPFFLSTLLLIELWMLLKKKKCLLGSRPEFIIAGLVIVIYALGVVVFYPDYLRVVLPLWMPYYCGIIGSWTDLLSCPLFLWCGTALVLAYYETNERNSNLKQVLAISIAGTLISYLIPQVTWYYHILPAVSLTFVYFSVVIGEWVDANRTIDLKYISLFTFAIFLIPLTQSTLRTISAVAYFHSNPPEQKLVTLLNTNPQHNHYMFLSMTHNLYDLEFYSSAYNIGSFSSCSWEYARLGHYSNAYKSEVLSFVLNKMADDLNNKKPQFVIIDRASSQRYLHQKIDYPKEYGKNPYFREEWAHYVYLTRIKPYDVYQRIDK